MKIAIDQQIVTRVPGLAIAAVDADGLLWSEGSGQANLATGLGMTPTTFRITHRVHDRPVWFRSQFTA